MNLSGETWNIEMMRKLLETEADVDKADEDGLTPLHQASQNGHVEAFKLLLAAGASTETRDKKGANLILRSTDLPLSRPYTLLIPGRDKLTDPPSFILW